MTPCADTILLNSTVRYLDSIHVMRRKVLEPVVPVLFKWLSYTVSSIAAKVGDIEVWCSEEYRGDGERKGIFFRCIVEQEEINVQGLQTTWATEESPELDTKDTIRLANRLLEALRKLSEGVLVHLEREEFMVCYFMQFRMSAFKRRLSESFEYRELGHFCGHSLGSRCYHGLRTDPSVAGIL